MVQKLLLVDDDLLLRRSLAFNLGQAGYQVSTAANAEEALAAIRESPPDLVLLDIGLPDMDGLTALGRIRELADVPVIFLTARRRHLDQLLGLELGADDYVTKPFEPDILVARIKAVLRRPRNAPDPGSAARPLVVGDLEIDPATHTVTVAGREVALTPHEFGLLQTLAEEAGHVISVDRLLDRVWGLDRGGDPQVVYVQVRWLRAKLEEDPQHPRRLVTVRGVGYKLVAQDG